MKADSRKSMSRWVVIVTIAIIALLIVAGAIYAQGPGRNRQQGPGQGRGFGQGMGPGFDQGNRPGMGGGPQAMMGMQFLMQDEGIRTLIAQVKIIEGINQIGLSVEQVEAFLVLSGEAQEILNGEFGPARDQIRIGLEQHLDSLLAGGEVDMEFIPRLMEQVRNEHDPAEIRGQLEGILTQAVDLLTDEQLERIQQNSGPGLDRMRERGGPMMDRLENLPDESREEIEGRIRNRMQQMSQGAAKMKLMMMLVSPRASEAMELWLDHN